MSNRKYKSVNTGAGFTLIELLVVIAIIGMLSSVVFASLNTARGKSRDARRLQDMVQIRNAIALYVNANNGTFPAGHYVSTSSSGSDNWNTLQTVLAPYIKTLPHDPVEDATHFYYYTDSFGPNQISDPPPGTCAGKAIILYSINENGTTRRDCTINNASEVYPAETVILMN